ncbi:MAG: hypothetical protein OIF57_15210 [Marinobacterium sp.]|nr:hypothetical protein [Marinobacterium sp.]
MTTSTSDTVLPVMATSPLRALLRRFPFLWSIAGIVITLPFFLLQPAPAGMQIDFQNHAQQMVQAIQLDFGNADSQSSIRILRIAPGETRAVLLNHQPGMGFNVKVSYADGSQQEFCALKGDSEWHRVLPLKI